MTNVPSSDIQAGIMAKSSTQFVCQSCGSVSNKWSGKCEACGEWNCIVEEQGAEAVPKGLSKAKGKSIEWQQLNEHAEGSKRIHTGIGELDRVLGGGLVEGSAILIGGDPGIGKSTLLLQMVVRLSQQNINCAYISGEESTAQISLRAKRLGLLHGGVNLASATSVRDIISSLENPPLTPPPQAGGMQRKLDVVIIDSIQTMYIDNIDAAPGTVSQVRACSNELIRFAKRKNIALFLVGHVTKDGQIAGPRVLEHMVDTVLYFEGERGYPFRILRSVKNRFGGTDEIGVFEMADEGLNEVTNPSALFLTGRTEAISGAAVFAGIEGSRPLLVEIQALVSPSYMSSPRRAVVGWDGNRLSMLLAVLETRLGLRFSDKEVYLNVAGGLRISEPAADLAVAAALISAAFDTPLPSECVFFGEIGLSGEIRQVARADARLKEAEKLGFKSSVNPPIKSTKSLTIGVKTLDTIQELYRQLMPAAKPVKPTIAV
jgi:DNA repair protein RadA/Sms